MSSLKFEDKRVQFIASYVLSSLKAKEDKWIKLWDNETLKNTVNEFIEKPEPRKIFFSLSQAGILLVLFPFLSNPVNHSTWPTVVSHDVMKYAHSLKRHTEVLIGHVNGKTVLPIPNENDEYFFSRTKNKSERSCLYAIETLIIEWSHQVYKLLLEDKSKASADTEALPVTEVEYWNLRASDLDGINLQISSKNVQKMIQLLETHNSCYLTPFKDMYKAIVYALMEANNMTLFLKPLRPVLEDMEGTEFEKLSVQFGRLFHLICLSWVNSEYFRIPGRLVTFLRKVSNLVIIQLRNYLDPTEVLKGELEDVHTRITMGIKMLSSFKKYFELYRKKLPEYFSKLENPQEPIHWEFSETLVFGKVDKYRKRLDSIKLLLENAMEFEKLDRVVIGGILGETLSTEVQEIFEEFGVVFKVFSQRNYDCLDPDSEEFLNDYHSISVRMDEYDQRLGSIFCRALAECPTPWHAYKLLTILSSLANRKQIKEQLEPCYTKILQDLNTEVSAVRKIVTAHEELAAKWKKASDVNTGNCSALGLHFSSFSCLFSIPPSEDTRVTDNWLP
ncbi:unnamed protein product [Dibothriocephalus latus]|uniref:Dynein heavy chain tail domain-containing protein n=1 Tax=Dibothriocephalus latus TaxID=60516 RepID=A0A3P7LCD1_DIBLA|nr:unnamed protein product [Dibothriocephalus latus]